MENPSKICPFKIGQLLTFSMFPKKIVRIFFPNEHKPSYEDIASKNITSVFYLFTHGKYCYVIIATQAQIYTGEVYSKHFETK